MPGIGEVFSRHGGQDDQIPLKPHPGNDKQGDDELAGYRAPHPPHYKGEGEDGIGKYHESKGIRKSRGQKFIPQMLHLKGCLCVQAGHNLEGREIAPDEGEDQDAYLKEAMASAYALAPADATRVGPVLSKDDPGKS